MRETVRTHPSHNNLLPTNSFLHSQWVFAEMFLHLFCIQGSQSTHWQTAASPGTILQTTAFHLEKNEKYLLFTTSTNNAEVTLCPPEICYLLMSQRKDVIAVKIKRYKKEKSRLTTHPLSFSTRQHLLTHERKTQHGPLITLSRPLSLSSLFRWIMSLVREMASLSLLQSTDSASNTCGLATLETKPTSFNTASACSSWASRSSHRRWWAPEKKHWQHEIFWLQ